MFIACKCLNVVIIEESGHVVDLEIEKLGLSALEQRDPFFTERLVSVCDGIVRREEPLLVESHQVGIWVIHQCLVCRTFTHAINSMSLRQTLVNIGLSTSEKEIEKIRLNEKFSSVFNILVSEPSGETSGKKIGASATHPGAGSLNKKLTRALQSHVDAVEEAVRLFREKKYAEFEDFREKAHRDHRILSSILCQTDSAENAEKMMANINRNTIPLASNNIISSKLISNKNQQQPNFASVVANKPRNTAVKNMVNLGSYKDDSLDSEGIFDLEGMEQAHNGLNSDVYDSDTDDSVSRDEGIHIMHEGAQQWNSIAKSLPVNMPAFTHFHDISQDRLDQHDDEPQDIAASIKALARSVHGDVFGDLPRPRFSTQI